MVHGYLEPVWLREHDLMEMDVYEDTLTCSMRITWIDLIILVIFNALSFTLVSCFCKCLLGLIPFAPFHIFVCLGIIFSMALFRRLGFTLL